MTSIGILHPGEMGVSVAASAINNGYRVYWVSQDRSDDTRRRAEKHGLLEINTLDQLCQTCDVILSVCPPYAAQDVAASVAKAGFKGIYLDANAISPKRSIEIGALMEAANIHFVDGGIIGGPAWSPKETCLYLSSQHAAVIADCFEKGPLETQIIGSEIGKASALKMCYAAYSKGTTALLAAIVSAAEVWDVREVLYERWDMDTPGFSEQTHRRVARATKKAWRFEGEMMEIAATFQEAGLPGGFHEAAAEVYHRMANLKENNSISIEEIISSIVG